MLIISLQCHVALFYLDDVTQLKRPAVTPVQYKALPTTPEFEINETTPVFRTTTRATKETGIFAINIPNHFYYINIFNVP